MADEEIRNWELAGFLSPKFKRNLRRFILWSYLVMVVLCLLLGGVCFWLKKERAANYNASKQTYEDSNTIMIALIKYYNENGHKWPESLEKLEPNYIKKIPQPSSSDPVWVYMPNEKECFPLAIGYLHSKKYPPFLMPIRGGGWRIVGDEPE